MAIHQIGTRALRQRQELIAVQGWRRQRLLDAGFPAGLAASNTVQLEGTMSEPSSSRLSALVNSLTLDTSPYLSCDECFNQLDAYVERVLSDSFHQDQPMQVHLTGCGACAEEADALLELVTHDGHWGPTGRYPSTAGTQPIHEAPGGSTQ